MRALEAAEILRIWELGQDRPQWQRGLLLLAPCFPDQRPSALAALPLERRNRLLLELREHTLGPTIEALVRCPACHTPLEFTMTVRELLDEPEAGPDFQGEVEFEGVTLRYRLPNSHDLAAAAVYPDVPQAALTLAQRSIVDGLDRVDRDSALRAVACVEEEIARRSPLTDIRIALRCVANAQHVWPASLDIVAYFWSEVDRMARQLMDDVQALARGYGWQEAGILAMSESRRQFYLGALHA